MEHRRLLERVPRTLTFTDYEALDGPSFTARTEKILAEARECNAHAAAEDLLAEDEAADVGNGSRTKKKKKKKGKALRTPLATAQGDNGKRVVGTKR